MQAPGIAQGLFAYPYRLLARVGWRISGLCSKSVSIGGVSWGVGVCGVRVLSYIPYIPGLVLYPSIPISRYSGFWDKRGVALGGLCHLVLACAFTPRPESIDYR